MCDVKTFNVVWSSVKCNLNPTNYINTTEPVMWNVSGHTHETSGTQLHAHRQSNQPRGESPWYNRTGWLGIKHQFTYTYQEWKDGSWGQISMILRKIYICSKVWYGMVCCIIWNVCGLDGLQSVWSGAEWCGEEERMVWNGGMKLRCGVKCHGVVLNVLWYG